MGLKYLLSCRCGQQLAVEKSQAGTQVSCRCGLQVEVPTLRRLVALEKVGQLERSSRWSQTRGILFVCGVLLLLGGGIISSLCYWSMPPGQFPGQAGLAADLDGRSHALGATETLQLWNFYRDSPRLMIQLPGKTETLREQRALLAISAWVSGIFFLLAGLGCFTLALRDKQIQHPS
ncbi:MAG: class T serpentine receptor [Planctomycetales bacterium]